MAVLDLWKRIVGANTARAERRADVRVRPPAGAQALVVDDSATIRAVLGKMLVQDGYEVVKVADGESALEATRGRLPDLVFLDIVLPGISGFAALRTLRHDARTRAIPIVMMSGNPQATEQFYVQRFGADGFIRKPFRRADVFHAIRSLVEAGRLDTHANGGSPAALPDGMTAEEWDAIPDVGLPDDPATFAGPDVAAARPPAAAPVVAAGPEIWRVAAAPVATPVPMTVAPPPAAGSPVVAPATWYQPLQPQPARPDPSSDPLGTVRAGADQVRLRSPEVERPS